MIANAIIPLMLAQSVALEYQLQLSSSAELYSDLCCLKLLSSSYIYTLETKSLIYWIVQVQGSSISYSLFEDDKHTPLCNRPLQVQSKMMQSPTSSHIVACWPHHVWYCGCLN